jgi:hypothetical protein
MNARGLSGSELKTYTALSPMHNATLGSSNPVDLSEFTWLNVIATAGCVNSFTVTVKRSATSAGVFGECASIALGTGSQLVMRGIALDSSACFYRADYSGTGSANVAIIMQAQGARRTPVDQESTTTVLSSVLG